MGTKLRGRPGYRKLKALFLQGKAVGHAKTRGSRTRNSIALAVKGMRARSDAKHFLKGRS